MHFIFILFRPPAKKFNQLVSRLLALFIVPFFFGCNPGLKLVDQDLPTHNSQLPSLYTSAQGTPYLSWIEQKSDTSYTFKFSTLTLKGWSDPLVIAEGGEEWFLNWSETPKITAKGGAKGLVAYWLEISTANPYDHDIKIVQSADGGKTWSNPFTPHPTEMKAYYGQCAFLPLENERVFMTWLDGRTTKMKIPHTNRYRPSTDGEIMLAAAEFDQEGKIYNEKILDDQISSLSPPDVGQTKYGKIVVYRNRTDEHIKDIYFTMEKDGKWSKPKPVWEENWICRTHPVSGPQLAINEEHATVVWYSEANDSPKINLSSTKNGNTSFSAPIRIDNGNPTGMPDIVSLPSGKWVVSWLEQQNQTNADIMIALVDHKFQIVSKTKIAEVNIEEKSSYPQLSKSGKGAIITWANRKDAKSTIHTKLLKL